MPINNALLPVLLHENVYAQATMIINILPDNADSSTHMNSKNSTSIYLVRSQPFKTSHSKHTYLLATSVH